MAFPNQKLIWKLSSRAIVADSGPSTSGQELLTALSSAIEEHKTGSGYHGWTVDFGNPSAGDNFLIVKPNVAPSDPRHAEYGNMRIVFGYTDATGSCNPNIIEPMYRDTSIRRDASWETLGFPVHRSSGYPNYLGVSAETDFRDRNLPGGNPDGTNYHKQDHDRQLMMAFAVNAGDSSGNCDWLRTAVSASDGSHLTWTTASHGSTNQYGPYASGGGWRSGSFNSFGSNQPWSTFWFHGGHYAGEKGAVTGFRPVIPRDSLALNGDTSASPNYSTKFTFVEVISSEEVLYCKFRYNRQAADDPDHQTNCAAGALITPPVSGSFISDYTDRVYGTYWPSDWKGGGTRGSCWRRDLKLRVYNSSGQDYAQNYNGYSNVDFYGNSTNSNYVWTGHHPWIKNVYLNWGYRPRYFNSYDTGRLSSGNAYLIPTSPVFKVYDEKQKQFVQRSTMNHPMLGSSTITYGHDADGNIGTALSRYNSFKDHDNNIFLFPIYFFSIAYTYNDQSNGKYSVMDQSYLYGSLRQIYPYASSLDSLILKDDAGNEKGIILAPSLTNLSTFSLLFSND